MPRLRLPPTRSSLVLVEQRLALARQGHRLLEKKRDVLVIELKRVIDEADAAQREAQERFAAGYAALQRARVMMGTERVHRLALTRQAPVEVQVTPRSVMGVEVLSLSYRAPEQQLSYGFGDTSVLLDQAQREWAGILGLMGRLAQTVNTAWRLALELRRTQRRVNALEHVYIPTYEETAAYIRETLEEKDREDLFRLKRAKARLSPPISR